MLDVVDDALRNESGRIILERPGLLVIESTDKHRASLCEHVCQVDTQDDQKNDREDLLVVLCDDPRQENIEVGSIVIRVTPGYSSQGTLPRIHYDDDDLRSDQEERHIEKSIELHVNDRKTDVKDGHGHHEPNQRVDCFYEVKHQ